MFSIPGVGRLIIGGILSRDFPVIQGGLLFLAVIYLAVNLRSTFCTQSSIRGCVSNDAVAILDTKAATRGRHDDRSCGCLQSRSFLIGAVVGYQPSRSIAVFADCALSPFDPLRNSFRTRLRPPGRDLLVRHRPFRSRHSLPRHPRRADLADHRSDDRIVTGIGGTIIGATAGYFPALDNPIMRLMDALMAFPAIVLAIAVAAVLGASVVNVIIALSIATMPHTARIVRASVLVVREREYVEAARALGAGPKCASCAAMCCPTPSGR